MPCSRRAEVGNLAFQPDIGKLSFNRVLYQTREFRNGQDPLRWGFVEERSSGLA